MVTGSSSKRLYFGSRSLETQRFLALADCELALLRSVSDSAKIGYGETF